ncbi:UDP-N-acetylmuramate dehydrogenase [Candidatus Uabimicrobium amorphum]|uniref:UDP-N-acetylenolpyruvoylglucosamine reductase n=1 Tax=Uabimicrobium amorphum TaxID=2596890 RepID=A0A5S9IKC2_UABAM|nr:UDP-N-acetylmuramate dehydrogenase [Candidatus Uabimicrobium amorphum]BBM83453.1 UDP-N-acetylenolpyruvoylglucosamine reductase [Candidatus Uabimicrobium amorphum]
MNEKLKKHMGSWSQNHGIPIAFDVDLRKFTYFYIGGKAQVLFTPTNIEQMQQCIELCTKWQIKPKILGKGSNLLIATQQIPVVIATKNLCGYKIQDNIIIAHSGASLAIVVRKAVFDGLSLEKLVGIPGTVGGAVYGNAGTKINNELYAIGDFVEEVKTVSLCDAKMKRWQRSEMEFAYRSSGLCDELIVEVQMKIPRNERQFLIASWKELARKKSATQPYKNKSAGCIFRNPPQLSAWKLIHQAKLAELSVGDIMVSPQHANFIINKGNGCAQDVLQVIANIQQRIYEEFGIRLVLEIQIW